VIPADLDALLTRTQTALALTESGFPVADTTLATKATRGGGPPFQRFGRKPLYRWGDSLAWARARLTAPMKSTSEADAAKAVSNVTKPANENIKSHHSQPANRVDPREHDRGGTYRKAPGAHRTQGQKHLHGASVAGSAENLPPSFEAPIGTTERPRSVSKESSASQ
jgi:hypothetical protein